MRIRYFPDTDTLLVDFNKREIAETRDLNEDVLIDLDKDGNIVSMTFEHAKDKTDLSEFLCELTAR